MTALGPPITNLGLKKQDTFVGTFEILSCHWNEQYVDKARHFCGNVWNPFPPLKWTICWQMCPAFDYKRGVITNLNSQPQNFFYSKVRAMIGKKWDIRSLDETCSVLENIQTSLLFHDCQRKALLPHLETIQRSHTRPAPDIKCLPYWSSVHASFPCPQ